LGGQYKWVVLSALMVMVLLYSITQLAAFHPVLVLCWSYVYMRSA
jgi:hypothetical protein